VAREYHPLGTLSATENMMGTATRQHPTEVFCRPGFFGPQKMAAISFAEGCDVWAQTMCKNCGQVFRENASRIVPLISDPVQRRVALQEVAVGRAVQSLRRHMITCIATRTKSANKR
jgi:hypothetical protein